MLEKDPNHECWTDFANQTEEAWSSSLPITLEASACPLHWMARLVHGWFDVDQQALLPLSDQPGAPPTISLEGLCCVSTTMVTHVRSVGPVKVSVHALGISLTMSMQADARSIHSRASPITTKARDGWSQRMHRGRLIPTSEETIAADSGIPVSATIWFWW